MGGMPDGEMKWRTSDSSLSGFESYKTIEILYNFPNGIKSDGTHYGGATRSAFLPASPEGILIFHMLLDAFRKRLSFLVGDSLTTGAKNVVVWAGIHHKSSRYGGQFGYPDATYLNRVKEELKSRDVDEDSIQDIKLNLAKGYVQGSMSLKGKHFNFKDDTA